jgi:hypothetical protein
LDSHDFKQGIFFKGQIYDAFKLITDIFHTAKTSITVVDNYADDSVLDMLSDKKKDVFGTIVTSGPKRISEMQLAKFNEQYPSIEVVKSDEFHDRFIIIDDTVLYHLGASLKDAGKRFLRFRYLKMLTLLYRK